YGRGEAYCFLAMKGENPRLYTLAIQDFSRYLRLNPQGAQARLFRAYCYEKLGDYKNARADAGDLLGSSRKPSDLRHTLLIVLKHIHGWHTNVVSSLRENTGAATSAGSPGLGPWERDLRGATARSAAEARASRS